MQLVMPSAVYEASYRAYIEELGDEERYPFPLDFDHQNFSALLAKLDDFRQGINLPEGFVASTTFWLVDDQELVGVANLRHELNERIRHAGGHIGLGIRPSRRGKGLGILLLQLTLERARAMGITPIHVHCYKANVASAQMILANHGRLTSEIDDASGVIQRYLVD